MILKEKYSHKELVALVNKGDQIAFDYLYDSYAAVLLGIIYKIVGSQKEAENVLQQVFVKIWHDFKTYNETKGTIFTWMLVISRNCAADFVQSKPEKACDKIRSGTNFVDVSKNNSFLNKENNFVSLNDSYTSLNPEETDMINLSYFQGFTQNEIAKQLQTPLETVTCTMRNCFKKLNVAVNVETNPIG